MKNKKPLSDQNMIRFLAILVLLLALTAGYYHSAYKNLLKNYQKLKIQATLCQKAS